MQNDNDRLKHDLDKMRDEMRLSEDSHHRKYRKLLKDMQEDIERYVGKT